MESTRTDIFSPLKTSSSKIRDQSSHSRSCRNSKPSITSVEGNPYSVPKKQNIRIMTVNCRSIKDKSQELTLAIDYLKPDVICGTESWLKGIKPGKNPSHDAIKSSEVFPPNFNVYRNDRGTLGGGVFILVEKSIVSEERTDLITNCEIEWVKMKTDKNKDMLISSFYMPQRNKKDLDELSISLEKASVSTSKKNIILAGDFNCPDIERNNMSIKNGNDRDIQQQLIIDIANSSGLSQIHDQPTRGDNLLDLVFTANPSFIKSSVSVPGISDHAIVITDLETKPHYQKNSKQKNIYLLKSKLGKLESVIKKSGK
ncbi:hypothetical protein FSP39_014709 [Pinctada imbricata]|uniref:Endonuclease/exonuclease/phosphatase domain-containing protein n=1 Tax=Pinctada imbricata TaxID=66713 RepID=A0AA88YEK5_PINIB|nr:hypothetical protein FSP39_014709 [Pinctada imbricata]